MSSLVIVVASVAYNVWIFSRPTRVSAAAATTQAPPVEGVQPVAPTVTGEQSVTAFDPTTVRSPPDVELDRAPEWSRNPFVSSRLPRPEVVAAPVVDTTVEPDVVVASILHSADRTLALVNGRIVRVGDRVGSHTVVEIQPRAIVVESPRGGRRTVDMRMPLTTRAPK